jgi:hypothetical protein
MRDAITPSVYTYKLVGSTKQSDENPAEVAFCTLSPTLNTY